MVVINQIQELFADARAMYDSAVERWDAGDIRDSAEKAWCATLRATNALILARTGEEPEKTPETSGRLDRLARQEPEAGILVGRYYSRQQRLRGDCFYSGIVSTRGFSPTRTNWSAESARPSTTSPMPSPSPSQVNSGSPLHRIACVARYLHEPALVV